MRSTESIILGYVWCSVPNRSAGNLIKTDGTGPRAAPGTPWNAISHFMNQAWHGIAENMATTDTAITYWMCHRFDPRRRRACSSRCPPRISLSDLADVTRPACSEFLNCSFLHIAFDLSPSGHVYRWRRGTGHRNDLRLSDTGCHFFRGGNDMSCLSLNFAMLWKSSSGVDHKQYDESGGEILKTKGEVLGYHC